MSVVTTMKLRDVWGTRYANLVELDFDNSYPTGGEAVSLDDVELADVDYVVFPENKKGYAFEWDDANSKVKVYYGDNNNAADGPLVEVPNTTDLSALTDVRAIFVGTK